MLRSLRELDVANKRVLVRVDYNVPSQMGASPTTPACARACPLLSICSLTAQRLY
jgi:3-phosphoglycerate kinase